jgi:hypothetical protein
VNLNFDYVFAFSTASVLVRYSSLYCEFIHYMLGPNWPSLNVQIVRNKAVATSAGSLLSWYCAVALHGFIGSNFSLVPVCCGIRCVCLLHQMHPNWWSAIVFVRSFAEFKLLLFR